jgi:predicted NBD/HSP70 family sugar kinase
MAFGTGKDSTNLVVIKVGRGVGAGIVIGRQLYYGDGFGAGEIGHIVVRENGEPCNCGRHGCLETLISSRALVKYARQIARENPNSPLNQIAETPESITTDVILQACEDGDSAVADLIEDAARQLGKAIAYTVGVLNIKHVIIGGSLARFGSAITDPAQEELSRRILPALAADTVVEASSLGTDIVLLGCAALILSLELGIA